MRLFIALVPSAAVLDDLELTCAPLRSGRADLRWTSRELWHITLAFLGEVTEEGVSRLVPRLERAAHRHRPFGLGVAGAGAFPRPTRANVLWAGLGGDLGALRALAMTVGAAARRAGTPSPDKVRGFTPHLTLARCRAPADVTDVVRNLAVYQGPPWTVAEVSLVQSTLGTGEPKYRAIGAWPLRPG